MPIWMVLAIVFLVLWTRDGHRPGRAPGTEGGDGQGYPGRWIGGGSVNGGQHGQPMANPTHIAGVQVPRDSRQFNDGPGMY